MQAQQAAQHVHKGMQLAVGGSLKQAKWTDKTTGQRREAIRVLYFGNWMLLAWHCLPYAAT